MAPLRNLLSLGALALVMQSAVFAEDLSEVVLAIRSADLARVEQFIQEKKYSKAEYRADAL